MSITERREKPYGSHTKMEWDGCLLPEQEDALMVERVSAVFSSIEAAPQRRPAVVRLCGHHLCIHVLP